jgi:hypothetical protein
MNQEVKQQGFLRVLWLIHTPKRLRYGHLLRPGSDPNTASYAVESSKHSL